MPTINIPELTPEGRRELAKEITNVQQGMIEAGTPTNLGNLLQHIQEPTYPTDMIVRELITLKLKWFAQKIVTLQYATSPVSDDHLGESTDDDSSDAD